jgi:DNA-binding transcriptional ArsR family regulator
MFRALADGSRRNMIERLSRGPTTVTDLAAPLDMTLPSVMQHLSVLAQAGIVESQKVGRVRTVQLVPGVLDRAATWIGTQRTPAERQADRLAAHLTQPTKD